MNHVHPLRGGAQTCSVAEVVSHLCGSWKKVVKLQTEEALKALLCSHENASVWKSTFSFAKV